MKKRTFEKVAAPVYYRDIVGSPIALDMRRQWTSDAQRGNKKAQEIVEAINKDQDVIVGYYNSGDYTEMAAVEK